MRYLSYEDFMFIVNLFNTYPKELKITFCIREEADYHFLIGTFDALFNSDVKKYQRPYRCSYLSPNGVNLRIYNHLVCDASRINRSNLMVIDSEYSAIDLAEVWTPLCNLPPVIGVYHYTSSFKNEYENEMLWQVRRLKNENKESN